MPRKSDWLLRLPSTFSELQQLSVPVVYRSCSNWSSRVGRRRAIQLTHRFGSYQSGRTFLIERNSLLRSLEALESGDEVSTEVRRKQRLSSELDLLRQLRALPPIRRVRLPEETPRATFCTLPGVRERFK